MSTSTVAGRRVTWGHNAPIPTRIEPNWHLEPNVDQIAQEAQAIVTDVREHDPQIVHQVLTLACVSEPARMAQILMALGAWVPDDEPISARFERVYEITKGCPPWRS